MNTYESSLNNFFKKNMFNRLKLSEYNQGQYFEFLRHISAFRKKINLEIDNLEKLLFHHAELVL